MKKTKKFIAELIMLIIQSVLVILTFIFAFQGTYEANRPSNIWSVIQSMGSGLLLFLSGFISLILGIIVLVTSKRGVARIIISIILIIAVFLGGLSLIYAIGSHF